MSPPTDEGLAALHAKVERYETYLANIAKGYWNVGRAPGKSLTAREYAREGLRVSKDSTA